MIFPASLQWNTSTYPFLWKSITMLKAFQQFWAKDLLFRMSWFVKVDALENGQKSHFFRPWMWLAWLSKRRLLSPQCLMRIRLTSTLSWFRKDLFVSSLKHYENNILHADIILPVLPQPSWNVEQYRLKLSTLAQKELKLKITLSSFKKCLNCQSKYLNRYERKTIGFVWYCPRFRDS